MNRHYCAFAVVVFGALVPSARQPASLPESVHLTRDSIRQAIELGWRGEGNLAPYRLAHEIGTRPGQKIAFYTPFIRVALAARVARLRGLSEFDPAGLPQWVTAPNVLVVLGSPCTSAPPCFYDDEEFNQATPLTQVSVGQLLRRPGDPRWPGFVHASEVTHDLSFLEVLGGPSFPNAMLAATFAPTTLRAGLTLFARWTLSNGTLVYSGGVISEAELREWR